MKNVTNEVVNTVTLTDAEQLAANIEKYKLPFDANSVNIDDMTESQAKTAIVTARKAYNAKRNDVVIKQNVAATNVKKIEQKVVEGRTMNVKLKNTTIAADIFNQHIHLLKMNNAWLFRQVVLLSLEDQLNIERTGSPSLYNTAKKIAAANGLITMPDRGVVLYVDEVGNQWSENTIKVAATEQQIAEHAAKAKAAEQATKAKAAEQATKATKAKKVVNSKK